MVAWSRPLSATSASVAAGSACCSEELPCSEVSPEPEVSCSDEASWLDSSAGCCSAWVSCSDAESAEVSCESTSAAPCSRAADTSSCTSAKAAVGTPEKIVSVDRATTTALRPKMANVRFALLISLNSISPWTELASNPSRNADPARHERPSMTSHLRKRVPARVPSSSLLAIAIRTETIQEHHGLNYCTPVCQFLQLRRGLNFGYFRSWQAKSLHPQPLPNSRSPNSTSRGTLKAPVSPTQPNVAPKNSQKDACRRHS